MFNSLKKTIYVLFPLPVYLMVHDLSRLILMYILRIVQTASVPAREFIVANNGLFSVLISTINTVLGALALVFLMKRDPEELALDDYLNLNGISFYRADKLHPAVLSWIVISMQGIAMAIGLNMLFTLTGMYSVTYEQTRSAQYSVPVWSGVIFYGIISPFVEELLFRLMIFGRMKRRFPYLLSVVVSSVFFGLYHRNIVQGLYATFMGIIMCLALEYVHSIVGAFTVHSLANISVYLLSSYNVFGTEGNLPLCVLFLGIGLALTIWEIVTTMTSLHKFGPIYGCEKVGCFFIDETLFADDEGQYDEE